MEKDFKKMFEDAASEKFLDMLAVNDKTVGTSAQLEKGMRMTLLSFDYIDGTRVVDAESYKSVPADQKHRYIEQPDGTYKVDNSYYAVLCSGSVSTLSFRTMTSAASAPKIFTDEGTIVIPAGRASQVAEAIKPYLGKTLEVIKVERWEADKNWNGRKQRFAGSAAAFKVIEEPAAKEEAAE